LIHIEVFAYHGGAFKRYFALAGLSSGYHRNVPFHSLDLLTLKNYFILSLIGVSFNKANNSIFVQRKIDKAVLHTDMNTKTENLAELGRQLKTSTELEEKLLIAERRNPWFVQPFTQHAFDAITDKFLNQQKLDSWLNNYQVKELNKTIALIFAGNLPLVGFHDFLCCYVAGAKMKIKLSSKDDELFPFVLSLLSKIDPSVKDRVEVVEILKDFDAVIATGSDNTNRYFEHYFRNYPKILRKNRNSVAILSGEETKEDLEKLADDIFLYFGFGCRNVSKLYVPVGYDLTQLFPCFEKNYKWLHSHNKYMNNYDYNRTLLMLNKTPHLANEFVMLVESTSIPSSIATLNYETWHDEQVLATQLKHNADKLQCIVAAEPSPWAFATQSLGSTQQPELEEYADGVDTMKFLLGLDGEDAGLL
jgi:hypothetical protein